MRIQVNNIGIIKDADIEINGITVLAGKNGTGKSTIGKCLYSMFNSLYRIDDKIIEIKKEKADKLISKALFENVGMSSRDRMLYKRNIRSLVSDIFDSEYLKNPYDDYDHISDIVNESFLDMFLENETIDELISEVKTVFNYTDNSIIQEVIRRYFNRIFNGQINCLSNPNELAKVEFMLKDEIISASFVNNNCIEAIAPIMITHEALLIDDPFMIEYYDSLINSRIGFIRSGINASPSESDNLGDEEQDVIDAIEIKEKLEKIFTILNKNIPGKLKETESGLTLEVDEYEEPIKIENLSAGLKSFAIIKLIVEKRMLKKKDVLILDEPEIHLHPEWQLDYAELLVLLQQQFELSLILTTHSSEFLQAINYFSKKYKVADVCKYYFAKVCDGHSEFVDCSDDLRPIYSQLVKPNLRLSELNDEIDGEVDE